MKLCDYCKGCQLSRVAKDTHPSWASTNPQDRRERNIYKKGEFAVECYGIPENYEDYLEGEFLQTHSDKQIEKAVEFLDPVTWANNNIGWTGRISPNGLPYQDLILRCSAKRKVLRMGRRSGKTNSIAVDALYHVFINKGFKVLIIAPFQAQVELIITEINKLIDQNRALRNSIVKNVKTPFYKLELTNGSVISAFTSGAQSSSGATSIRGQEANRLIIDEADYLNPDDINTINVILGNKHPIYGEPTYLLSSTPSGAREYFFQKCNDPVYKEFHFPSSISPDWSLTVQEEFKRDFTDAQFEHEVMAEFGELETGVFQTVYVEAALQEYSYEQMRQLGPQPNWIYCIGVDWNSAKNGTRIYVVGWDLANNTYKVVDKRVVSSLSWNLHNAVKKVEEVNNFWLPHWIYVDEGYGAMPIETLHGLATLATPGSAGSRMLKNVKPVNLGSTVELYDPWTRERIEKPLKPFFVQNAVRKFEQNRMVLPYEDEELRRQLLGYQVVRYTSKGSPVFAPLTDNIGDHDLDALMFALYAFTKEMSEFSSPIFTSKFAMIGRLGEQKPKEESGFLTMIDKPDFSDNPDVNSQGHPLPQSRTNILKSPSKEIPGANLNQDISMRKIWPSGENAFSPNDKPKRARGIGRLSPRRSFF